MRSTGIPSVDEVVTPASEVTLNTRRTLRQVEANLAETLRILGRQ